MKIVYVSGTRADYGLMKSVLMKLKETVDLEIVATGMHLMKEFGHTVDLIKKDGFKFSTVDTIYEKDDEESMSNFLGEFIQGFTKKVMTLKPDFIIVLGDRAEMLGAASVGTYTWTPVVHIHGGDLSSTVDEHVRHAITKLSHIHLAATEQSAKRIRQMGEEKWRINTVGAPGISSLLQERLSNEEIESKYNVDLSKPLLIVLQHPVSGENVEIEKTLKAVKKLDMQTIVIYPNADAGGRKIIEKIKESNLQSFENIDHKDFISLMSVASVLIGNSSSGLIEAPSFKLPVVNIGTRQEGRERATNVIDVDYDETEIHTAIEKALSSGFKEKMKDCVNPYFKENTPELIIKALMNTKIDNKLMQKRFENEI